MKNLFSPSNWGISNEIDESKLGYYWKYEEKGLTGWEKFALFFVLPVGILLAVVPAEWVINFFVNLMY